SFLAEKIAPWEQSLPPHIRLAYLPSEAGVKLRLTTFGEDAGKIEKDFAALRESILPLAGQYIFGFTDDPLEVVLGKLLLEKGLTLSAAESCTGGHVSHTITTVPGSSAYFLGSVVAYANEVKINALGVNPETRAQYGAVSEQTVAEMASGVRQRFGTDIGIATSGIAGPGGGTPDKPVGTIWIACADRNGVDTRKLQFANARLVNIKLTTTAVLNLVRLRIKQ